VIEHWMIGVLENILPDTLHARSKGDSVCAAFWTFKTLLSIPDHYSSTPLLQQPRDLRARFWPPSRGLQTKPRPLGVDSLLMAKTTCGSKRLIVVSISSRDNFFTSSVYREKPNSSSALPTSLKKIPPEQMMTHEGCKRQ